MRLSQVDGEETAGRPGDNEGGELNDWEREESPWNPEVPCKGLDGVWVGRKESELLLGWTTFAEIRVTFRGRRCRQLAEDLILDGIDGRLLRVMAFEAMCRHLFIGW